LCDSLRRANSVIILFFLGNFSWMTAIAGLLYQDNPQRLCNFYLLGDQEIAGRGLVAVAVLVPVAWLLAERRRIRRFLQQLLIWSTMEHHGQANRIADPLRLSV